MGRTSLAVVSQRSAEAAAARKAALHEMNPALREACQEMQSSLVEQVENNLRFYHRLGKRCLEIRENPNKYLTDEQRAAKTSPFELLERVVSTARETFRKCADFAATYDTEDLQRILKYRNDADPKFRLHWGHVQYLLSVDNKPQRVKLEEEAAQQMWSPDVLHKMIMEKLGGPRGKGGRPIGIPKSITAQVHQMTSMTSLWLRRQKEVWNGKKHSVFTNILNMPPEKLDDGILSELKGIQQQMREARQAAEENEQVCGRVIEQVAATIKSQGSGEKAAKPEKAKARATVKASSNGHAKHKTGGRKGASTRARAVAARAAAHRRPVPR